MTISWARRRAGFGGRLASSVASSRGGSANEREYAPAFLAPGGGFFSVRSSSSSSPLAGGAL